MSISKRISRRNFTLGTIGIGAVGLNPSFARRSHAAASSEVHIACVGVGGKGWSDMEETSAGNQIVAICDVDEERLAKAAAKFPKAKQYTDWRKLLEQKDIDAVTVSIPDHMHAPVTMSALQAGKHTYTQKPLAHSVYEARQLTVAAERHGAITQMGIQHHSNTFFKTAVKLVQDNVIGKVSDVHVWTDRPVGFWTQDKGRGPSKPIPQNLHWNNWLGVAPERPFAEGYHPFHWRAFWDFGTGALGDMGCHGMDPVVTALELGAPTLIEPSGPKPNEETGPAWSVLKYKFPGTKWTTEELPMTWYDGAHLPPKDLFQIPTEEKLLANGILFIGEKGQLLVDYFNPPKLLPESDFASKKIDAEPIDNHYTQWTDAIKGNGKTSCPFSYSGPLTETVLLGNVALRAGKSIGWNSKELRCEAPEANELLRREYRDGWMVENL